MSSSKIKKILSLLAFLILGYIGQKQDYAPFSKKEKNSSYSKNIVLTKHAKCRMKCRNINQAEIEEVLAKGKINWRKTKKNAKPCPVKAYEYRTKTDNQMTRVVAADCSNNTKIITVIDLDRNYNCYCK